MIGCFRAKVAYQDVCYNRAAWEGSCAHPGQEAALHGLSQTMTHNKISLIVQPGDSFFPIVEAIDSAKKSISLTIFRMDDPVIQQAMLEAVKRGVRVRALISSSPRGWAKENRKLFKGLKKSGVETKTPTNDSPKSRYHYKIVTVDGFRSLVLTFNPTRENLHYTRDYGVAIFDEAIATELQRLFDADWDDTDYKPTPTTPLLISPFNSRERIHKLLKSARVSIHISDAKLADPQVLAILADRAARGVEVQVLGGKKRSAFSSPTGIQSRQITRFKMHAKCIIVDSKQALIGSMNLRDESLDRRREVGVLVTDEKIIAQLEHVFASDWNQKSLSQTTAITVVPGIVQPTPEQPPKPLNSGMLEAPFALLSRTDALSRFNLQHGENLIGRSSDNDIVLSHPSVSRLHAKIVLDNEHQTLVDLKSQNGTFVNGQQVFGSTPLKVGDIVGIAQFDEYRFIEV